ncbi:bifunctional phosphopantothenoylcysteine decarboxylase/phosphopantothenate--cysteine ligase CoaBC [candidate division KSB1 bacterium]|nr:bifunctional phosphopantothenoylcysteine decarboxylase/phosphopantothenate--cysteine ligase CoaBC [candidate division KSB1 bacterium]
MVAGKKILVAVTGGIACYKVADLVRELIKSGAEVRVMMTPSAQEFIAPLTFATLTEWPVLTDLFDGIDDQWTVHIDWARWPDLILVAPATANTVAKLATGLADNAVTTTILASTAPLLVCPAMNKDMYAHPAYQANQKRLCDLGYEIVEPGQGELACGETGWGRLADKREILEAVAARLTAVKDLAGTRILITAGPTREPLDPVRFLGNRSSGKMGYALAERAVFRGGEVVLVSGPVSLVPCRGVKRIVVETAEEMAEAVLHHLGDSHVLIGAAAVSDYRPAHRSQQKIKRSDDAQVLELIENPDILGLCAAEKKNRLHVGFSVETQDVIARSKEKLQKKKLDFIVINNPSEKGAGFQVDTNKVVVLYDDDTCEELPLMSKSALADHILDRIASRLVLSE